MNKMNDKQVLNHLLKAVENDTPDTLESILLRCGQIDCIRQKGCGMTNTSITADTPFIVEIPKGKQKQKTILSWRKWAATAAAMLVIVVGAWFGYGYYSVDSIIDFDVNPSIEMKINRNEKVLSVTPLNADAEVILEDMNLKNVDLDIAVNALIGSMLKNGYVSEIKNSILISVENADAQKGAELQQRLSSEISSLLNAYSVGGAVLSQTLSEDEQLKALAEENKISLGKAVLVDLLVSQDPRLQFADVAALPINDINLLLSNKQANMQGVSMSGQASSGAYIGEAKAKSIALEHAGLSTSAVTYSKAKLDFDDGLMVYEVEFYTSDAEYEYEIDASSGQIVSQDVDRNQTSTQSNTGNTSKTNNTSSVANTGNGVSGNSVNDSDIGEAKAKSIALEHAGFAESAVSRLQVKLDNDDGRRVYEVEFRKDSIEYEYKIDTASGQILEWDHDYDD